MKKSLLKYGLETLLIIIVLIGSMYVFTLQRSEITALHIQIDTLKAKNVRLFEQTFIHDTISVYVFRGFVKNKNHLKTN